MIGKPLDNAEDIIIPDWDVAESIKSVCTTRLGGYSQPPYDSFNLATHVGDCEAAVTKNRQKLEQQLDLSRPINWLTQVHGCKTVSARDASGAEADAVFSREINEVCAVLTADCLPVLFCDKQGTQVAAAHAGWRGLLGGVLNNTIHQFSAEKKDIYCWLGPAIGNNEFEVGEDVRYQALSQNIELASCFVDKTTSKWLFDIYAAARILLHQAGIEKIYGGEYCTVTESKKFYSYRREGKTGRMASCIWIDKEVEHV